MHKFKNRDLGILATAALLAAGGYAYSKRHSRTAVDREPQTPIIGLPVDGFQKSPEPQASEAAGADGPQEFQFAIQVPVPKLSGDGDLDELSGDGDLDELSDEEFTNIEVQNPPSAASSDPPLTLPVVENVDENATDTSTPKQATSSKSTSSVPPLMLNQPQVYNMSEEEDSSKASSKEDGGNSEVNENDFSQPASSANTPQYFPLSARADSAPMTDMAPMTEIFDTYERLGSYPPQEALEDAETGSEGTAVSNASNSSTIPRRAWNAVSSLWRRGQGVPNTTEHEAKSFGSLHWGKIGGGWSPYQRTSRGHHAEDFHNIFHR